MDECPYIPPDLIEFLKKAFPDQLPMNPDIIKDRVAMGALFGEQTVIRFLEAQRSLQEEGHVHS